MEESKAGIAAEQPVSAGKTAFLFAGQGAQFVGMGKSLYEGNAAARAVYEMGERLAPGIVSLCMDGPAESLNRTVNTQPALFLTDLACAAALADAGIRADGAAGFSLGEIPALAFAGILTAEEAFSLVLLRGRAMDACAAAHPGGMAAVLKLEDDAVERLCAGFREIYPVNYNCPGQLVCAGANEELDAFCAAVKAAGGRAVKLAVSGAFHTPYMKDASDALTTALAPLSPAAPRIPLYANLTASPYPAEPDGIRANVAGQVCHSVRFAETLRRMAADGFTTFVEVGAGATLSKLVSRTLPDVRVFAVGDADSLTAALSALRSLR